MNAAINNLVAPDAPTVNSTLDTGNWVDHFNIDVFNQGVYWAIRTGNRPTDTPGMASWGPEIYMAPGSRSITRPYMTGIRFRAAIPAAQLPAGAIPARVTVEAVIGG